jgi:hypothetical protein
MILLKQDSWTPCVRIDMYEKGENCFISLKINSLDYNTVSTSLKKLHKTVVEGAQRN